jgi:hypothetical protein
MIKYKKIRPFKNGPKRIGYLAPFIADPALFPAYQATPNCPDFHLAYL